MYHCGLDGHLKTTQICVVNDAGKRVLEENLDTATTDLEALLGPLVRDGLRVGLETSSLSYHFNDRLMAIGVTPQVWPANKLRVIAESRSKTDRNDARWMAELLRAGCHPRGVRIPTEPERELRDLLVARHLLIAKRTSIVQNAKSIALRQGVSMKKRNLCLERGWVQLLADPTLTPARKEVLAELHSAWKSLADSTARFTATLEARASADPGARRLRTIPGVGLLSSLWLLSALGDAKRFNRSREVGRYLGVAPSVRSSAAVRMNGHITREGRPEVRWAWGQAAHAFVRSRASQGLLLRVWFEETAKRRGKKIAITALARKLMVIAWHMLKEETEFRGLRAQEVSEVR